MSEPMPGRGAGRDTLDSRGVTLDTLDTNQA